jgi:hypothetical protein
MSQATPYSSPTALNPAGIIAGAGPIARGVDLAAGDLEFSPGFDLPRPGQPRPVQIVHRGVPRLPDRTLEDETV